MSHESSNRLTHFVWVLLWASLVISFSLSLPGFAEFDTSKYLSISHTMQQQNHYLLAYWQGHPYSDKPPLLFWLIIAGWQLFGVNDWWPQLLVMLFATVSIFITQRLASILWPDNKAIATLTPFILIGCFYWVWFAKQIRVDSILVLATLLCLYFACKALITHKKYWLGYLLAVGLGGFAKGPVVLVFTLLPTLLLPTLIAGKPTSYASWLTWLGVTTVAGLCLTLLWAVPAAIQGGEAFRQEILFRQITHRVHMHQLSNWFYVSRLPLWLLPWTIYPPLWNGLWQARQQWRSTGVLTCLILVVTSLVLFSLFGQKLPHYLYPLFPILALLIAFFCSQKTSINPKHQWPMAILVGLFGSFCLSFQTIFTWLPHEAAVRLFFLREVSLYSWGSVFILIAFALLIIKPKTQLQQVISITLASVALALFINNHVLDQYQKHLSNKPLLQAINAGVQLINSDRIIDSAIKQKAGKTPSSRQAFVIADYDPKKALPAIWYYQTRLSIVGLSFSRRTK